PGPPEHQHDGGDDHDDHEHQAEAEGERQVGEGAVRDREADRGRQELAHRHPEERSVGDLQMGRDLVALHQAVPPIALWTMPAITRASSTIARPASALTIAVFPCSIWRGLPAADM